MERLNHDLFNHASAGVVANGAMAIVDKLQDMRPHTQVAAAAAVFLLLCESHKMPAQDAFTVITNIMNHAEGRRPEFAAVRQYMEEEL